MIRAGGLLVRGGLGRHSAAFVHQVAAGTSQDKHPDNDETKSTGEKKEKTEDEGVGFGLGTCFLGLGGAALAAGHRKVLDLIPWDSIEDSDLIPVSPKVLFIKGHKVLPLASSSKGGEKSLSELLQSQLAFTRKDLWTTSEVAETGGADVFVPLLDIRKPKKITVDASTNTEVDEKAKEVKFESKPSSPTSSSSSSSQREELEWAESNFRDVTTDSQSALSNWMGMDLLRQGLHSEAFSHFRQAAALGHPPGMYNLGMMHAKGYGVSQNFKRAVEWWEKAAVSGHYGAMYQLGVCYTRGFGVSPNKEKGMDLLLKAQQAKTATKSREKRNPQLNNPPSHFSDHKPENQKESNIKDFSAFPLLPNFQMSSQQSMKRAKTIHDFRSISHGV